jgi:hypothetical protein
MAIRLDTKRLIDFTRWNILLTCKNDQFTKVVQMMQGEFPPKKAALVTAWTIIHQKELLKNWDSLLKGFEAKKIDPLR